MNGDYQVLVLNPGSTSTKVAVFSGEERLLQDTIEHPPQQLELYQTVPEQYSFRLGVLEEWLERHDFPLAKLDAVAGRGGLLRPLPSGTYKVDQQMIADLKAGVQGEHPANLGGIMAGDLAKRLGIMALVVDPVAVDEMAPEARLSGFPEIERRSLGHALNCKRVARMAAQELDKDMGGVNLVLAHLGGGISVYAMRQGRLVDVDNANHEGPFSAERAGGLSTTDVIDLCFSGRYQRRDLLRAVLRQAGLLAYLGTTDLREVEQRVAAGDQEAQLVLDALVLQVGKTIGAMGAVLSGQVDAVVLTGGMAHGPVFTGRLQKKVEFLGPVLLYPGEEEMRALAEGALRILRGQESPKDYAQVTSGGER